MKRPPYLWRGLSDVLLWLPILFQIALVGTALVSAMMGSPILGWCLLIVVGGAFLTVCVRQGRRLVERTANPSENVSKRGVFFLYQPVILACSFTLMVALIGVFLPASENHAVFGSFSQVFILTHMPSALFFVVGHTLVPPAPWHYLVAPLTIYIAYTAGMNWAFWKLKRPLPSLGRRLVTICLFALVLGGILWRAQAVRSNVLSGKREDFYEERRILEKYFPTGSDSLLVGVEQPGLTIREDHPRLDGATAAYPVYAAAARAIYGFTDPKDIFDFLDSSKTPNAFQNLISGDADIIFALEPSKQQLADAKAAGVTLHLTPIAKEAFIFFVQKDNPVNTLTTAQIRGIYTKAIRSWSELGGLDAKIIPFQRPAGSGSQTILEQKVMLGEKPATPLREEYALTMGGILQRVASYQSSPGAVGYSFRFFATQMSPTPDIKVLEIDGIAPTRETIRSGAYPYTVNLYAITAGSKNPHAQEFIDWFLTPVGQKLIDDTGYVGLDR